MKRYAITNCPVNDVAQIARSRWTFPLLVELSKKPARFGELQKALAPITNRMLSASLKKTISAGLALQDKNTYALRAKGRQVVMALRVFAQGSTACASCRGKDVCTAL